MPRIEDSVFQDEVATSLLGPEQPEQQEETQSEYAVSGGDLLREAVADQANDVLHYGDKIQQDWHQQPSEENSATLSFDERLRRQLEREEDAPPQERLRSERLQENEQVESQPLTPEIIRESMAGLDTFVQENQLNRGEAAAIFPHELCASLGTTPEAAGIDAQGVIDFSAKSVVSGLRELELCGGDFSRIQPMPDSWAMEVGFDACKMLGYDPRGDGVNPGGVAQTIRHATLNTLKAIAETGYTDAERINSREAVEFFGNELFRNLGHQGAMPPAFARALGDTWTKFLVNVIGQLRQNQAQSAASQPRSRKASGQRIPSGLRDGFRGKKPPRFETNRDIFSGPGFEAGLRQQL
jgi:hypothetical protein